jgi:hypothetical protein
MADIVSSAISISVGFIEPEARSLTYIEAVAAQTYIEPVFQAFWLDVQVEARTTMPDVLTVEILTTTDNTTLHLQKPSYDQVATSDYSYRAVGKSLFDVVTQADFIHIVKIFIRSFGDTFSVPDFSARQFTSAKYEIQPVIDDLSVEYTKNVSELLSMADAMDGGIQYQIIKVRADSIESLDAYRVDFSANKADNVSTSSSGVLSMQDYCDITYFLEDYVGLSRAFS